MRRGVTTQNAPARRPVARASECPIGSPRGSSRVRSCCASLSLGMQSRPIVGEAPITPRTDHFLLANRAHCIGATHVVVADLVGCAVRATYAECDKCGRNPRRKSEQTACSHPQIAGRYKKQSDSSVAQHRRAGTARTHLTRTIHRTAQTRSKAAPARAGCGT